METQERCQSPDKVLNITQSDSKPTIVHSEYGPTCPPAHSTPIEKPLQNTWESSNGSTDITEATTISVRDMLNSPFECADDSKIESSDEIGESDTAIEGNELISTNQNSELGTGNIEALYDFISHSTPCSYSQNVIEPRYPPQLNEQLNEKAQPAYHFTAQINEDNNQVIHPMYNLSHQITVQTDQNDQAVNHASPKINHLSDKKDYLGDYFHSQQIRRDSVIIPTRSIEGDNLSYNFRVSNASTSTSSPRLPPPYEPVPPLVSCSNLTRFQNGEPKSYLDITRNYVHPGDYYMNYDPNYQLQQLDHQKMISIIQERMIQDRAGSSSVSSVITPDLVAHIMQPRPLSVEAQCPVLYQRLVYPNSSVAARNSDPLANSQLYEQTTGYDECKVDFIPEGHVPSHQETGMPSVEYQITKQRKFITTITPEAKSVLNAWVASHMEHPYPSRTEKEELCAKTGLDFKKVSNWFCATRKKILTKHPLAFIPRHSKGNIKKHNRVTHISNAASPPFLPLPNFRHGFPYNPLWAQRMSPYVPQPPTFPPPQAQQHIPPPPAHQCNALHTYSNVSERELGEEDFGMHEPQCLIKSDD